MTIDFPVRLPLASFLDLDVGRPRSAVVDRRDGALLGLQQR
jgi:hypothetical protein